MLKVVRSNRFERDVKRAVKRNLDISKLAKVIDMLAEQKELPAKYKDHALTGNWKGCRDCHIEPDWVLIYKINHNKLLLNLLRTGTHSDILD